MTQYPTPSSNEPAPRSHATDDQAERGDPVSSADNPYAAGMETRNAAPDLDAHAPELKTGEQQRINRRALGFLGALVLLLGFAAIWMIGNVLRSEKKQKERDEVVTVPAAPQLPQTPPSPPSPPAPPPTTASVEPIQLATPPLPPPPATSVATGPRGPTLMERRMGAGSGTVPVSDSAPDGAVAPGQTFGMGMPGMAMSGPGGPGGSEPAVPANSAYRVKPPPSISSAQPLYRADTLMVRGTYVRCVLETRIISDIPGPTSCVVTEPVYSFNGKRLLLPKGSKVLGKYESEPNGPRLAVIWDRILTPNGIDVNMASPGIDNLGGAGHPGHVDEHWFSRVRSALLISLFADAFKYAASTNGPSSAAITGGGVVVQSPYESATAQTLQNLANMAVRRSANRPDTVTINQGTVAYVYVAKDVDFSGVVGR